MAASKPATTKVHRKRGVNAGAEVQALRLEENRTEYKSLTNMKTAELALVGDDFVLTDKAKAFVKFWAQGESIHTASERAGYTDGGSYAYRLIHVPKVKAMYAEEKRLYEEASNMSRKKVMDMLVEAYDMAKLMAEPASMVSAAREIGKMCGYYEPVAKKVDITVNGKALTKRLDQMSDEDLAKMIAEGMGAIAALEAETEDDDE